MVNQTHADVTGGLAVYMRVSSAEQKQQGTIENQRNAAERYIALHAATPYGWYADDGVSGTIPFASRPEGARLLADAAAGYVQTLVCWRLDRMGRNALAVLQAVAALERAGVRLVSITESFDTSTPAGRLQLNMLATIAQFERDSIMQRSEEGMSRRLQDTTWMGGRAPIGYRVEGRKKSAHLVINDTADESSGYSEADIVRLAWHLLVEQDWPCDKIAEHLTTSGIPTREGGAGAQWAPGVVYRMLSDPIYTGTRTHLAKDGTLHAQPVPALLTQEQHEKARAKLREHKRYSHKSPNHDYLLRDLMRCDLCGAKYTTSWSRLNGGTGKLWRYYACSTRHYRQQYFRRHSAAPQECIAPSVDAVAIESQVWSDVEEFIRNPGRALALLAAKLQRYSADP